jgi:transcription-repair coupling factor (superfamily II helicase)
VAESEFLYLEYKGGDRLYVPIQDFKQVQKYVGAEGKRPPLNSLDRVSWERTKEKVRKEVADLARELLKTAAAREALRRPAGTQEYLMKEFEDAFPYEETPDQLAAIQKVLSDLESPRLMDHLVCGDVGYGKTEIAMRAAFRAVLDSKQAAVLVPTTILAEQHFKNFSDRFAAFPVKIGMISRFQSKADQKKILESAAQGTVDILVGTHRLIQKDVQFKNWGLIIIDEEHRFGVRQKEALKKLKVNADFLALSATPIPRTLSLAMGGIRNISVVESPPEGRLPIDTRVGLFDRSLLKEAVERELARGGQIFYVHNRIQTLHNRKEFLEKLFPAIRIGMAHGQMSALALEAAMWNFLHRKWDILLSTTIIESGLDIPNVNTLIVEDSDEFGLAQLYQLRGRVGRQRQKAYCLLFFSDWAKLSEDARKRLTAIQEFSALGSGMKLALRDMEIRGTGNLLGSQQHGWIAAVGLDLYCQLLSEEAEKVKRGEYVDESDLVPKDIPPEIDLDVSAFIPQSYVEPPGERIALYKKMLSVRSEDDLEKIRAEMLDRFGSIPLQAENLLKVMSLSVEARNHGLGLILQTSQGIILGWNVREGESPLDLARFAEAYPDLIEILPPDTLKKDKSLLKILFNPDFALGVSPKTKKLADNFVPIDESVPAAVRLRSSGQNCPILKDESVRAKRSPPKTFRRWPRPNVNSGFKEEITDPFGQAKKFLKLALPFATIMPYD